MTLARETVRQLADRLRTSSPLPGLDWPASYRAIVAELCRRAGDPEPDWSDER